MANIFSKTSNEDGIYTYKRSVNTPDYSSSDWLFNPDVSALENGSPAVPERYWKIEGSPLVVVEMTQEEKDAVDSTSEEPDPTDLGTMIYGSPLMPGNMLEWDGTNWIMSMPLPPSQHVHVAKNGNDTNGNGSFNNPYLTINAAISSITDNSITKPYVITVNPGIYNESPISINPFICISGVGHNATHIMATDNSNPLFVGMDHTFVMECAIHGPDSSSCLYITDGSVNFGGQGLIFISGNVGVEVDGGGSPQGGKVVISNSKIYPSVDTGLLALNGGTIECSDINNHASSKAYSSVGFNSKIVGRNISANYSTDAYYVDDGGHIKGMSFSSNSCTNVLHVGSSLGSPKITQSLFDIVGLHSIDTLTNEVFVEHEDSDIRITGASMQAGMINVPNGYNHLHLLFQDPGSVFEPEAAIHSFGDLVTGRADAGSDSWFGQGNTYIRGIILITTDDTTSSTSDGGNFIDVSDIAKHRDTPDTFTFQGTGENHSILIGADLNDGIETIKHWGYLTHVKTAAVEITPRSFVVEIWNGSIWKEIGFMIVHSTEYYRYSNYAFIRPNIIEVLRLGVDHQTTWEPKTINGKNIRWSRIRIANDLTTLPTFHHFHLTPSMTEINVDGTMSFHGHARYRQTVIASGNIYGESGGVSSVYSSIGSDGIPTGWWHSIKNSHMNGNGDAIYMQFTLPRGVCTSCPFRIRVVYEVPDSGGSSNGTIIISVLPIQVSDVLIADSSGGIEPIPRSVANTDSVTDIPAFSSSHSIDVATSKKLMSVTSDDFVLDNYYEGDMLAVRVEYDNDGNGNKDITIWCLEVNAAVWTHGERL